MKKMITVALLLTLVFTGTVSAFASGNGGMRQRLQTGECTYQEECPYEGEGPQDGTGMQYQTGGRGGFGGQSGAGNAQGGGYGNAYKGENPNRPQDCPYGFDRPMDGSGRRWQIQ